MEQTATRAKLLEELGQLTTPGALARAAWFCTDEQLQARINGAKAQRAWYEESGFEDERNAAG